MHKLPRTTSKEGTTRLLIVLRKLLPLKRLNTDLCATRNLQGRFPGKKVLG